MSKGTKEKLRETINIFHKNNIDVIPHFGVKEGNNTKTDFTPNTAWKTIPYSYEDNIKAVEKGILGFMVRSGSKSNISVIDYDFHGIETTNITNILQRLKDTFTFYTTTPSGGYHFYFKYEPRFIKNEQHIFNNIDIRNEGGLLFLGIRNDGEYIINDEYASIKVIPEDILKELLEWTIQKKENKDIDEQTFNNARQYKNGVRYNITDEQLYKYLYDLPTKYLDDTTEWKTMTFILKEYGYMDIWKKWSKPSKYYNAVKNKQIWNTMTTDKNTNDLNYIIKILNDTTYKDNKIGHIQKIFKEYNILNEANLKKITSKICVQYLDKYLYENENDIIINSGLNTGKTTSNAHNALKNKQLYFSIVALISTQESQYETFKNIGVKSFSYKNMKKLNKDFKFIKDDYEAEDTDEIDDETDEIADLNHILEDDKEIDLNKCCIFTTVDSLLLFRDKNINFKNRIVLMDEIHSLFLYLLRCDNLSKKRMDIFSFIIKILRECKQIIAVDGDICNNTIKLMDILLRKCKYNFTYNTYKAYNNIKCFKMSKMDDMIDMIVKDIKNKEFNICCCNTKTLADKLEEIYIKNGVQPSQILKYTSKSGKPIKNINEEWKDKYVIYSPSIVAGLDFTPQIPMNTYSFIDGVNTLNPEQIGQQICRNRKIKNVYLYMVNMTNTLKYEDMNALKSHFKENVLSLKTSSSFLSLMNKNYNDDTNEIEYTDTLFNKMYYELEYQNDIMKSSYEYNLYNILTNKGFIITDDTTKPEGLNKELNTIITEKIKENDEKKYDSFVNDNLDDDDKYKQMLNNQLDILGIDKNDTVILLEYEDIINNQIAFNTHLKIRSLLYNDEILKIRAKKNLEKDYFIKAISNNIIIVSNYKRIMRKYIPNIDLYKYQYNYDDEYLEEPLIMENDDFKYIKSVIRTTKYQNIPTRKRDLVDLMTLYATLIFGKDMIKSVKKNTKINGKDVSYYSRVFNEDLFKQHTSLFKIYLMKNKEYIHNICNVVKNKYYTNLNDSNDIDGEVYYMNKIIKFYNDIARDEKIKIDMINKPKEEAEAKKKEDNEVITKKKAEAKEQKYIKTVAKMTSDINKAMPISIVEKETILKEYQIKHKQYITKSETKANISKAKAEQTRNKPLTLKEKILLYLPIEPITNIEESIYFKQTYNDMINCTFIDKRNILQEYKYE